jgi:hypothetical protein
MLLATGQCVVFSSSALVMTSNDSLVRLLGKDYLKLRVRPRLTLDGGASLLAVGRTLPSINRRAPIVDTPLIPASNYLPAQREPSQSYTVRQAPQVTQPTHAASISVLRDTATAHTIPFIGPHSEDFGTSSVSANKPNDPRAVPAHLKYLIHWLQHNGGAKNLNLKYVQSNYFKVDMKARSIRMKWWKLIIKEAEAEGLVELTNLKVNNKKLSALGKERTIRLLHPGPFIWM